MSGTPPDSAAEPSMDEILSSIRRILKDDDAVAMPAPDAPEEAGKPVLDLDPSMIVAEGRGPAKSGGAAEFEQPGAVASAPALSPATPPGMATGQTVDAAAMSLQNPERLVSAEAAERAASHIDSLRRTVSADRGLSLGRGDLTIEDVVRSEVRPLLKAWLDAHLPNLVERIVRAEIERLIGEEGR